MASELARRLAETIERELSELRSRTDADASVERGPGKWSAKEELGHLIDSASNNHIRFAVGAIEGKYRGPSYAQEEWVRLHGYAEMPWETIVELWFAYNRLLAGLVERIPEERLSADCFIGAKGPLTLEFVIDDYIVHMQHHIDLLLRRQVVTEYPQFNGQLTAK